MKTTTFCPLALLTLLALLLPPGCGFSPFTDVDAKKGLEIVEERRGQPDFVILDIRTPKEFDKEHIEGAINIDYYAKGFRGNIDKLDKTVTYFLYCRTGGRTGRALSIFEELGFQDIIHLAHGIRDWKEHAQPTVGS